MSWEAWGSGEDFGLHVEGDCPTCSGTGYVDDDFGHEPSCPDCNGTGFRDLEYFDDDG